MSYARRQPGKGMLCWPATARGSNQLNTPQDSAPNPFAPPRAEVRDVATGAAAHVLATRGARMLAATVDSVIGLIPILVGAVFAVFLIGAAVPASPDTIAAPGLGGLGLGGRESMLGSLAAGAALWYLAWAIVTYRYVKQNGQTIGKRWVGIKVVRTDGSRASVGRIFWLRNVVNAIPGLIPVLGFFYTLIDHGLIFGAEQRCLHDRLADTKVVVA